jgi:hypothetical protein
LDRTDADNTRTNAANTTDNTADHPLSDLVEVLKDQVQFLRNQLDAEREANRENRRLLAAALERIPELEAPPRAEKPEQNPLHHYRAARSPRDGLRRSGRGRGAPEGGAALVAVSVLLRAVSKLEAERSKGFWHGLFRR